MTRVKFRQSGVTVIELLVLLVIVGILAGLVISTHAGISQKENNTARERDIDELRDELEAYYSRYNEYPTLAEVNDPGWRADNMKGISREVLRDPSSGSYDLAAKPAKDVYAYTVTSASGKPCDNTKTICTQYTLTATLQGGGTYVKNNLN